MRQGTNSVLRENNANFRDTIHFSRRRSFTLTGWAVAFHRVPTIRLCQISDLHRRVSSRVFMMTGRQFRHHGIDVVGAKVNKRTKSEIHMCETNSTDSAFSRIVRHVACCRCRADINHSLCQLVENYATTNGNGRRISE